MLIHNLHDELPCLTETAYTMINRDLTVCEKQAPILNEQIIEVYLNDRLTMKIVCIPMHLPELILGRLLTENMITNVGDVESIVISEDGARADVRITRAASQNPDYVETVTSCCAGNHILNDAFVVPQEPKPVRPIPWKPEWIFQLADLFAAGMPLHGQTWATHSCFLSRMGTPVFSCEDIGRHNALDKVIGFALRNGIPLDECIVYSSGRVPTDMIQKALRAGIPVFSSKASPTQRAVALAGQYQLTLICSARRDCMKQYTGKRPDNE